MLLLQAFQVSDQAVRLLRDGWFQQQDQPSGESTLRDPKVRCSEPLLCPHVTPDQSELSVPSQAHKA